MQPYLCKLRRWALLLWDTTWLFHHPIRHLLYDLAKTHSRETRESSDRSWMSVSNNATEMLVKFKNMWFKFPISRLRDFTWSHGLWILRGAKLRGEQNPLCREERPIDSRNLMSSMLRTSVAHCGGGENSTSVRDPKCWTEVEVPPQCNEQQKASTYYCNANTR